MTNGDKLSTLRREQNLRFVHSYTALKRVGRVGGRGKTAVHGERQGPTTGRVLYAARFIPTAHSVDLRYKPNRSDKTQNHRSKHWLSSALGTETFV